ncbi:MAG: GNAT family N-acetyltransferase [Gemmatimonadaceae bacterium]
MSIRPGVPSDATILAGFAARVFNEAFGQENRASDMEAHLAASYGEDQQGRELRDPSCVTLLIEDGGRLIAFAQVRQHQPPLCVTGEAPIELYRFYVDRPWHGQGIAQWLMAAAQETARDLGGGTLWLTVWERNPRAIAFYTKCGYRDVGATDFFVGPDRQVDRILVIDVVDQVSDAT